MLDSGARLNVGLVPFKLVLEFTHQVGQSLRIVKHSEHRDRVTLLVGVTVRVGNALLEKLGYHSHVLAYSTITRDFIVCAIELVQHSQAHDIGDAIVGHGKLILDRMLGVIVDHRHLLLELVRADLLQLSRVRRGRKGHIGETRRVDAVDHLRDGLRAQLLRLLHPVERIIGDPVLQEPRCHVDHLLGAPEQPRLAIPERCVHASKRRLLVVGHDGRRLAREHLLCVLGLLLRDGHHRDAEDAPRLQVDNGKDVLAQARHIRVGLLIFASNPGRTTSHLQDIVHLVPWSTASRGGHLLLFLL